MAPRRNRAGTRPTIHEDRTSREGSPIVQSSTPRRAAAGREPLGELSNAANTPQPEANIILEIDLSKPAKKSNQTVSRGASNDALVPASTRDKENVPEVAEDRRQATASPAVDAACRSLRKSPGKASPQRPLLDSPRTPASRAVTAARKMLARDAASPELSNAGEKGAAEILEDDSGSPASKATLATLAGNERLEESVVAFDALEDAIAEIGAALPTAIQTPTKNTFLEGTTQTAHSAKKSLATPRNATKAPAAVNRSKASVPPSAARRNSTLKRKSDALKPAGQSCQTPNRTPQQKKRFDAQPCGRRSTIGARSVQRPASLRKAPFVPERSSKPATVSTFALPGEAVAAKLKARREEREKRASMSGQLPAQKGAAVRPNAATVRGTAFAGPNNRARAHGAPHAPTMQSSAKPTIKPALGSVRVIKPTVAVRSKTMTTGKRTSSASTTATQVNGNTRASHKVPVTVPRPPRSLAGIFTPPSSSEDSPDAGKSSSPARSCVRPRVAAAARPAQSSGAASVQSSGANERKAREEAARKARKEAAERGRLASREWAERQRLRQQAAEAKRKGTGTGTGAPVVVLPRVVEMETK